MNRTLARSPNWTELSPLPQIDDATRREFLIGATSLLALAPYGCGGGDGASPGEASRTFSHAQGESEIPVRPRRIVVVGVGYLADLLEFDAPVVGATEPDAASAGFLPGSAREGIELVGTDASPDVEAILRLRPDLLIVGEAVEGLYENVHGQVPTVVFPRPYFEWRPTSRKVADAAGALDKASGAFDELDGRITDLSRRARSAGGPTLSVVRVSAGALYAVVPEVWCKRLARAAGFAEPPNLDPRPDEIVHGVAAEVSPEEIGRIDANKIQLNIEPIDIRVLLNDVMQTMRAEIQRKQMRVKLDLAEELPVIEADERRLTQVVLNLMSNAVKYTYAEGEIELRAGLNPSGMLEVGVTDNGVGMTQEQQQYLFRRFYRADNPLRDEAGGTGLGLSIAKSFVELHGGEMWVRSEIGEGSTFSFVVPVTQPERSEELTDR